MAERNFPYVVVWVLFLAAMFTGAGLLLSPDAGRRGWGLVLLLAPAAVFAALMALYYWRSRRMARQEGDRGGARDDGHDAPPGVDKGAVQDVEGRGVPGGDRRAGRPRTDEEA